jgi:hypothetical protein
MDYHQFNLLSSSTFAGLGAASLWVTLTFPGIERRIPLNAIGWQFLMISGCIGIVEVQTNPWLDDKYSNDMITSTMGVAAFSAQAFAISQLAYNVGRMNIYGPASTVGIVTGFGSVAMFMATLITKRSNP